MRGGDAALGRAKQALRDRMRALRGALSGAAQDRAARALCERLLREPAFARAAVVAGYVPVHGELDPRLALACARARGAVVVWPRVCAPSLAGGPRLAFFAAPDTASFLPGRHGIPEPPPGTPQVSLFAIDCFLVPGLAFDRRGHRLGQGGGYYDELAAYLFPGRAVRVGVGYDFQQVKAVPVGAGDIAVDRVITVAPRA